MVLLLQEIGLNVLVSAALIAGYLISIATQEEIEKAARSARIEKIFGYAFITAETLAISYVLGYHSGQYFQTGGVILLVNMVFSALYNAEKSDLQRTIGYMTVYLVLSLIIGTAIIIL